MSHPRKWKGSHCGFGLIWSFYTWRVNLGRARRKKGINVCWTCFICQILFRYFICFLILFFHYNSRNNNPSLRKVLRYFTVKQIDFQWAEANCLRLLYLHVVGLHSNSGFWDIGSGYFLSLHGVSENGGQKYLCHWSATEPETALIEVTERHCS